MLLTKLLLLTLLLFNFRLLSNCLLLKSLHQWQLFHIRHFFLNRKRRKVLRKVRKGLGNYEL